MIHALETEYSDNITMINSMNPYKVGLGALPVASFQNFNENCF